MTTTPSAWMTRIHGGRAGGPGSPRIGVQEAPWALRTHPKVNRNTGENREMFGKLFTANSGKAFARKPLLPLVAFVVDVAAAVAQTVAPSPSRPSRVPSTSTRRWNSFRNHSDAAASSRTGNDTEIVHIFAKTIALRAFFVLRHPFVGWWL